MSIRLDPRRLTTLKQLAAEADVRPGELVRIWVEQRIDAERRGEGQQPMGPGAGEELRSLIAALSARVAALEAATGGAPSGAAQAESTPTHSESAPSSEVDETADTDATAATAETSADGDSPRRRRRNAVSAQPAGERVALHDEMIAVLEERGPLSAAELASAIVERGRYSPPRSGKPLDALTINARVSNPTYRGRFTRSEGRIGLAENPSSENATAEAAPAEG